MQSKKRINIDTTNKCSLGCPSCLRQSLYKKSNTPFPGGDISIEDFDKITDYFKVVDFNGQISDPTLHDDFHSILEMCVKKNIKAFVHNASTARSDSWYHEAFKISEKGDITWIFAIDGLPSDSSKYRINQDGERLYKLMKICSLIGINTQWNCIVFNYNENDLDTIKKMAEEIEVKLSLRISSRWEKETGMDKYRPSNPDFYITRDFDYNYKQRDL